MFKQLLQLKKKQEHKELTERKNVNHRNHEQADLPITIARSKGFRKGRCMGKPDSEPLVTNNNVSNIRKHGVYKKKRKAIKNLKQNANLQ